MRKLMVIVIALLVASGVAFAQDATPPVFCGDLSEADCAILTQSQAAMMSLSSAAFDFQADINLTNVPDTPGPVSFTLTGNGAYTVDPAIVSAMAGNMTAMQDPVAMMTNLVEVLRGVDFDFSLTLNLPPELAAEMGPDTPENITLQLRLADGLGYINADTLAPLMGDDAEEMGVQGWLGLDIASLIEALVEQNPEIFESMDMSGFDPGMYAQLSSPEFAEQFTTVTRTDDGSGNTATFETTVDFAALINSPEFQELMQQQMEAQGQELSEEELQQGMAMSQAMLSNSTVTSTTTIDTTTGYVVNTTFDMAFDLSAMAEAMPEEDLEELPAFTLSFVLNSSQFNEVPEITEPEDATVFPYEQILTMFSSMPMPSS